MVLVEFSMALASMNLKDILFEMQMKGYQPVIAHPERYIYLEKNKDFYDELKDIGCMFQLNLLAVGGFYGKAAKELANYLIKNEYYDLVGTDLHHYRHLEALENPALAEPLAKLIATGKIEIVSCSIFSLLYIFEEFNQQVKLFLFTDVIIGVMNAFTIKDLENLSGIKAHTIRIWEQRYNFLKPQRTTTNIRYYTNDELKTVLNIALLNKYGFKISHIDRMQPNEIRERILSLGDASAIQERVVNDLVQQMVDLDMETFEKTNDQLYFFKRN